MMICSCLCCGSTRSITAAGSGRGFPRRPAGSYLLLTRSDYIDQLLIRLWQFSVLMRWRISPRWRSAVTVAGELHPLSDIDILLLSRAPLPEALTPENREFIAVLWDLKLTVGHSVRTLDECIREGLGDLTVATNRLNRALSAALCRCSCSYSGRYLMTASGPSPRFLPPNWQSRKSATPAITAPVITRNRISKEVRAGCVISILPALGGAPPFRCDVAVNEMAGSGFLTDAEREELNECLICSGASALPCICL